MKNNVKTKKQTNKSAKINGRSIMASRKVIGAIRKEGADGCPPEHAQAIRQMTAPLGHSVTGGVVIPANMPVMHNYSTDTYAYTLERMRNPMKVEHRQLEATHAVGLPSSGYTVLAIGRPDPFFSLGSGSVGRRPMLFSANLATATTAFNLATWTLEDTQFTNALEQDNSAWQILTYCTGSKWTLANTSAPLLDIGGEITMGTAPWTINANNALLNVEIIKNQDWSTTYTAETINAKPELSIPSTHMWHVWDYAVVNTTASLAAKWTWSYIIIAGGTANATLNFELEASFVYSGINLATSTPVVYNSDAVLCAQHCLAIATPDSDSITTSSKRGVAVANRKAEADAGARVMRKEHGSVWRSVASLAGEYGPKLLDAAITLL